MHLPIPQCSNIAGAVGLGGDGEGEGCVIECLLGIVVQKAGFAKQGENTGILWVQTIGLFEVFLGARLGQPIGLEGRYRLLGEPEGFQGIGQFEPVLCERLFFGRGQGLGFGIDMPAWPHTIQRKEGLFGILNKGIDKGEAFFLHVPLGIPEAQGGTECYGVFVAPLFGDCGCEGTVRQSQMEMGGNGESE